MQPMLPNFTAEQLEAARSRGQNIIFVTGVFDILHEEHRRFLEKAKALGGFLLVGIESDVRVRQIKGEGRPVNSQDKRQKALEALGVADAVFVLPEEFNKPEHYEQIVVEVRPTFLAVSSHTLHQDKKKALVEKYGGQLAVVHEHNPEVSTTKILSENK